VRSLLIARIGYGSRRQLTPSLLPAVTFFLSIGITRFARIGSSGVNGGLHEPVHASGDGPPLARLTPVFLPLTALSVP
jgi:hypothetical protein